MRRRVVAFVAAAGFVALSTGIACSRGTSVQTGKVVPVTIVFQCGGVRSVSPWEVHVRPGDGIDWVLDSTSDVTSFEIKKKKALSRWLYGNAHPARGNRTSPAQGRDMRGGSEGRHAYNIEAQCPGQGGSTRTARIDPDIIVD